MRFLIILAFSLICLCCNSKKKSSSSSQFKILNWLNLEKEIKNFAPLKSKISFSGLSSGTSGGFVNKSCDFRYEGTPEDLYAGLLQFRDHLKDKLNEQGLTNIGGGDLGFGKAQESLSVLDFDHHSQEQSVRCIIIWTNISNEKSKVYIDITLTNKKG